MNAVKELELIPVKAAAKKLNITENGLRLGLQQKLFPFGVAVKQTKEYSYYIFKKRLEKYLNGEL